MNNLIILSFILILSLMPVCVADGDNTTALNQTDNSSGYWQPVNIADVPDFSKIFLDIEGGIVNMLESWGLDPMHTVFSLFVVAVLVLIMSQLFVNVTSKSSGIFKPVMYLVVLVVLLLMLGVI